jgi:hypothetical protein
VTVVANADSFALACRRLQGNYESIFKHRIAEVRATFGEELPGGERAVALDLLDQALEAHARAYVINGVLAALNWRIDSLPEEGLGELVPEGPVLSFARPLASQAMAGTRTNRDRIVSIAGRRIPLFRVLRRMTCARPSPRK